ncbi:hypothetical protein N0V88_007126 [Collariella sp. IMI 366227]|nr:hypothetical protein N0V88_007126 [Collariella sp. IMI 366227]
MNPNLNEYDGRPVLTPEQYAALPHNNDASKLLACIWGQGIVSTIFLSLRIYCRLKKRTRLWWDDIILIAAWVCLMVETSVLTYLASLGYGLHVWDFDDRNLGPVMLSSTVSGTFSVTAAVWAKTSFGVTLLQITDGWYKKATWFCLISMNLAMFFSALLPWVSCTPIPRAWNLSVNGTCWDPKVVVHYHMFSAAYSAWMDIVLAVLPWKFLWGLQMKRKEKVGVIVAMSLGIVAGITAMVKTAKLPTMLLRDSAESLQIWYWGNAEVCFSIIAACIPMLRVLVRDVKSSSRGYHSRYYADKDPGATANHSRFVTITSRARPAPSSSETELHKLGDDRSDRSILGKTGTAPTGTGIVQVTEVSIKYDEEAAAKRK